MSIETNLESIAKSLAILAAAHGGGTTAQVDAAAEAALLPAKKRGRPAAVEKVVEAEPEGTGFLDDEDEPAAAAAPIYTKDDVKKALMAAQGRLVAKYADAQKGLAEAMKILKEAGGVERLGQLGDDPAVFKKIIDKANAAK